MVDASGNTRQIMTATVSTRQRADLAAVYTLPCASVDRQRSCSQIALGFENSRNLVFTAFGIAMLQFKSPKRNIAIPQTMDPGRGIQHSTVD